MKIWGEACDQAGCGTLFGVDESGSSECLVPVDVVSVGGHDLGLVAVAGQFVSRCSWRVLR